MLISPEKPEGIFFAVRFLGTIGVDLFFVLSGYLIGNILIKHIEAGRSNFKDFMYFWMRRWFKTLPNYFLILLINIFLVFCFGISNELSFSSYFVFLQNFSHPIPDFFTESWSLSIEEFSYIVGPLLLYILLKFHLYDNKVSFLITSIFVIACGICFRYYYDMHFSNSNIEEWSLNVRKVVIYRIDSIYYGFLAASVSFYYKRFWFKFRYYFALFGLLIFFALHASIYFFHLNPSSNHSFYNQFYLPALLISLACFFPWTENLKSRSKSILNCITYLSLISYSLYLVNYSIILLGLEKMFDIAEMNSISKFILIIGYLTLSFLFAHLLYKYYELPIMKIRENKKIKSIFL